MVWKRHNSTQGPPVERLNWSGALGPSGIASMDERQLGQPKSRSIDLPWTRLLLMASYCYRISSTSKCELFNDNQSQRTLRRSNRLGQVFTNNLFRTHTHTHTHMYKSIHMKPSSLEANTHRRKRWPGAGEPLGSKIPFYIKHCFTQSLGLHDKMHCFVIVSLEGDFYKATSVVSWRGWASCSFCCLITQHASICVGQVSPRRRITMRQISDRLGVSATWKDPKAKCSQFHLTKGRSFLIRTLDAFQAEIRQISVSISDVYSEFWCLY